MNDRLRFRCWQVDEKFMRYDIQRITWWTALDECSRDNEKYIVMQCTGLKDKNGKLIWEGDVVKIRGGYLRKVAWCNFLASFTLQCTYEECDVHIGSPNLHDERHHIEIIGNIYQHPELLNTANVPQLKEAE